MNASVQPNDRREPAEHGALAPFRGDRGRGSVFSAGNHLTHDSSTPCVFIAVVPALNSVTVVCLAA